MQRVGLHNQQQWHCHSKVLHLLYRGRTPSISHSSRHLCLRWHVDRPRSFGDLSGRLLTVSVRAWALLVLYGLVEVYSAVLRVEHHVAIEKSVHKQGYNADYS